MRTPDELQRLEQKIRQCDAGGIEARWDSGQFLNNLKGTNKQLPKGALDAWSERLKVSRSELSARMKFAKKFPSAADLSTVVDSFRTWHRIKQNALTDKPRPSQRPRNNQTFQRVVAVVENLDLTEDADRKLFDRLKALIERHEQSMKTLGMGRAA